MHAACAAGAAAHGSCSGYTGNVCGNNTYGIPTIKMEDGPQGFRGQSGTSTSWPSGMTIGTTWDRDAASKWGNAMGDEFYRKGANVQLGPGVCLARVPRNGRNFEYIRCVRQPRQYSRGDYFPDC